MSFDKTQLTKLLIHTLKELGYNETSITLQRESGGIQIESNLVQSLFKCVKDSNYTPITFKILSQLPLETVDNNIKDVNLYKFCETNNIIINNNEDKLKIENIITTDHPTVIDHFNKQYDVFYNIWNQLQPFLRGNPFIAYSYLISLQIILLFQRQYFMELINLHIDYPLAIKFLRNTITKFQSLLNIISTHTNQFTGLEPFESQELNNIFLKRLTEFITNPHAIELKYPTSTIYKDELIQIISKVINPDDLIPSGRLITLLKQSIQYQKSQNGVNLFDEDYNNDTMIDYSKYSLLEDNKNFNDYYKFNNIRTLNESNGEIWYLQFSPDGKYLASATSRDESDKKIFIYDVENDFQVYRILIGNTQSTLYLSFSPDGKYLVSCPFNDNANIYFIHAKGEPINTYNSTSTCNEKIIPEIIYPVDSLEISADFKLISTIFGSNSTTSRQYNQESTSTKSSARIWCCDWFHTPAHENIMALGSPDRGVLFYNFDTKTILYTMSQRTIGQTGYVAESPTTQSNQRMIQSFNTHTGNSNTGNDVEGDINMDNNTTTRSTMDNTKFPHVHDLKISNDDKYLILMSNERAIEVYDISKFPTNDQLLKDNNSIIQSYIPLKISEIIFEDNIKLTCISLPTPTIVNSLKLYYPTDPRLLEHLVLVNATPNKLELWNYKENILMQRFSSQKQEQYIIRSCFGYNNKIVMSGSEDGRIFIWDKLNGKLLNVLPGHTQSQNGRNTTTTNQTSKDDVSTNCNIVAWSPTDNNLFVSGGDDGLVKIWKISYGK
ncbi:glucose-induced degradation protein 7 [Monosporozyma unispora]|nr:hypothetical protein C6P44_002718 [Kazachstania unispora]